MKTLALIATALVATTSSAAMAGTFTAQARASVSVRFGQPANRSSAPVIRDHRTPAPIVVTPASYQQNRFPVREGYPMVTVAPKAPINIDCRNWDPMTDPSSACNVYGTHDGRFLTQAAPSGWTSLGTREASVPDMQYITVESSFRQLWVTPVEGRPALEGIGIKFMDGTWQTITLDNSFARGRAQAINITGGARHEISQIVFYPQAGAHGSYSAFAL